MACYDETTAPYCYNQVQSLFSTELLMTAATVPGTGNRAILEAELALARTEHGGSSHPEPGTRAPHIQVLDRPQPSFRPKTPAVVAHHPFISTCVHLTLTRLDDETGARFEDDREQPLSTVCREDALVYGAVVIDIPGLGAVKCGIVGTAPRVPASPAHDDEESEASAPEETIRRLVSLADSGDLDLTAHYDTISSPGLGRSIAAPPTRLRPTTAPQLAGLPLFVVQHVAEALDSNSLCNAQALSICVDGMDDEPAPLLAVLAKHERIRHVSFLEGSCEASDRCKKSARLFAQICASPFAAALLGSRNLFVTAAFPRLSDVRPGFVIRIPAPVLTRRPCEFLPMKHIEKADPETTVWPGRRTGSGEEEEEKVDEPAAGDAIPGLFVSGFLRFCQSVLEDRYLMSFASTPSTAASGTGPIGPLSGEVLAIPEHIDMPDPQKTQKDGRPNRPARPDYVDMVLVIKEFIQKPMPTADHAPFVSQLESTLQCLRARWRVGRWPHGAFPAAMDLFTTLDDVSARDMSREFLADAARVRDTAEVNR
ncbi:hypothetical protein LY76DRAFT_610042 [Colletotrichum caudatum]|nr:hypothetical protein LY76DRAFT_610042 [Colletotrichum caudatum]